MRRFVAFIREYKFSVLLGALLAFGWLEFPQHQTTPERQHMKKAAQVRMYRVDDVSSSPVVSRLIVATSDVQALKTVTGPRYNVSVPQAMEAADLVASGVVVEHAVAAVVEPAAAVVEPAVA